MMNIFPKYDENGIYILDNKALVHLKALAFNSPEKRARICLHSSENCPVQEMVIALWKGSYIRPHKHPADKPESYHVISGILKINIFEPNGAEKKEIKLSSRGPMMYRINGNVWHQPVAISDCVIYHEVYTGPFNKSFDVIYEDWQS